MTAKARETGRKFPIEHDFHAPARSSHDSARLPGSLVCLWRQGDRGQAIRIVHLPDMQPERPPARWGLRFEFE